ncbi:MAG TPA: hypothetical protein VKM72_06470 [Thermoanaerobaculia bacterium]|nr:hypothetical protein [Thermoanaerobaculia bacterium]
MAASSAAENGIRSSSPAGASTAPPPGPSAPQIPEIRGMRALGRR